MGVSNDDDYIYFDAWSSKGTSGSEYLAWDDSPGEFDLSDDLNISGNATTTGNLYVGNRLGVNTINVPHGGVGAARIAIDGTASSAANGPNMQFTVDTDDYPVLQILPYSHDNAVVVYDAYYDGSWKSSDSGSSFSLYKNGDEFSIKYGVANAGSALSWSDALSVGVGGGVTSTNSLWVGSSGTANTLDLASGDLYVADDLEVDSYGYFASGIAINTTNNADYGFTVNFTNATDANINLQASRVILANTGDMAAGSNYGQTITVTSSGAQIDDGVLYGQYMTVTDSGALSPQNSTSTVYGLYAFADQTGGIGSTTGKKGRITYGVWAAADGATSVENDINYGGVFLANSSAERAIGIVAATSTTYTVPYVKTDWAGWFKGNVMVTGQLYASGSLQAAGSNDYAEYMRSSESLEPGDVVIFDQTIENTVKKSLQAYDQQAIGIVSTKPGILAGGIQNANEEQLSLEEMAQRGYYPIAFIGQVPVKISGENGEIKIGDLLTTANTPGYAMKATEKSIGIIGQALENFSGDKGLINVLIKTSANLDNELKVANNIQDNEPLIVIDHPELAVQTLTVEQAAIFYGTITVIGEAQFEHTVVFKEKIYVSHDTAGVVTIVAGATTTDVLFAAEYETIPYVVATPHTLIDTPFAITNRLTNGFTITIQDPLADSVEFDWIALAPDPALALEESNTAAPVITAITATHTTAHGGDQVSFEGFVQDSDTTSGALTYRWTIDPVLGQLSGADTARMTWTVAAVPVSTAVTITLVVSDGTQQVSQTKTIVAVPSTDELPPDDTTPTTTPPMDEPTPAVVSGCTDSAADNYNPTATDNDGSCSYPEEIATDEGLKSAGTPE